MIKNKVLKIYAYYDTGGSCEELFEPTSTREIADIMAYVYKHHKPYFLLGGGTNSLVMDEYFPGAVIIFKNLHKIEFRDTTHVYVEAGVDNSEFARCCLEKSLGGMGWMYRLPGKLGGTVRMNARCYGGEISKIIREVTTVDQTGKIKIYNDSSVFRGYKNTVFMDNHEVIVACTVELFLSDKNTVQAKMNYCEQDRTSKGQFVHPTCGCVFKNNYDVGVPSGMLLDAAGAKVLRTENISINPQHANFVYNKGATSRDILQMTFKMRNRVYEEFGVWLDYEMEILGKMPDDLRMIFAEQKPQQFNRVKINELKEKFKLKQQQQPELAFKFI